MLPLFSHVRPRYVAALVVALLLLCLSLPTHAQTTPACAKVPSNQVHICWSPVTLYTDGTAIPAGTSVTYSVLRYVNGAWTTLASGLTGTDWTSGVLPAGEYRLAVVASAGGETSARSTSAQKTLSDPPPPKPAAPVIVIAQVVDGQERKVAELDLGYPYVIRLPQTAQAK